MNDGQSSRQQIVEKIKNSTNILVTVSANPSVDELSSAIGLTSMLNGLKKHATAVVSGDIPPAITFLEPSKTFENTVDSLRDFIIALDKEKADHLRYKVEGDVVKIFITPYRTTISQNDLDFSQGDYNVELVLALGVKDQDSLDKALAAHGKILHDATVATLSCGETASNLGQIDWFEPNASSIAEMLVSMSEALKADKPIIDEQSATAFLTGIVAATDRFSNSRTSSKVMTMAAQLMAAGANQQLIAAKLEEAHAIGPDKVASDTSTPDSDNWDGTPDLTEGESNKLSNGTAEPEKKTPDGELAINHELEGTLDQVAKQTAADNQVEAAKTAEEELAQQLSGVKSADAPTLSPATLQQDLASERAELDEAAPQNEPKAEIILPPVETPITDDEPSLGGTLNATAEQAQHDKQHEIDNDMNKTILSHGSGKYVGDSQPTFQSPFNAASDEAQEPPSVDIFNDNKIEETIQSVEPEQADEPTQSFLPPVETLEDIDRKNRINDADVHADVRSAVELAYEATPLPTQVAPVVEQAVLEQMPPAMPAPFSAPDAALPPLPAPVDFSQLPPPPPLPTFGPPQGPLPPEQLGQIFGAPAEITPPAEPVANDPNQFKIPGQ
ncbi:hypothetical protein H7142_02820 [Candidatus Saccharibacteria bacterium]|nr:hypothetical protein [Candidatus Saccharibacteria bacterium]